MTDTASTKSFPLSAEFVERQFRSRRQQRIRHSWFSVARFKRNMLTKGVLQSFLENSSFGVVLQIVLAVVCTLICQSQELEFNAQMSLFVGPLVFPLAFSINACYQRREKVLDDLANLKASAMELFFCHRDWWKPAGLSENFLVKSLQNLRDLMGYVQAYLKKPKGKDRVTSLGRIYHCMSEIALASETLRSSRLPMSGPLVTRLIHYNNVMCWSFERLRVVRDYRSPRTIQAFSKVLIFVIPIVLSPYYVHIGNDPTKETGPKWAPYFVAILVSFVLGSLQAVEDALDDPFDGISEDDINLDQLQDWAHFALIVSPSRSLYDSAATSVAGSIASLQEVAAESSVQRRNKPDSERDDEDTSVAVGTSMVTPSSVSIDMTVQQTTDDSYPSLMSSPLDLLRTTPVDLGPLDIDVDSFAWSQSISQKYKDEALVEANGLQSSTEEKSLTPGSVAALRKEYESETAGASVVANGTKTEKKSQSPEVVEPDNLLELQRTLDKLEQNRMRRQRNSEDGDISISPVGDSGSPVTVESPTFDHYNRQSGRRRRRPSGSGHPLPSTPEGEAVLSVHSPNRNVRRIQQTSSPAWSRLGHSLTDLSNHHPQERASRSPIVPAFSWTQNPHGLYRTRSESLGQDFYLSGVDNNRDILYSPRQSPMFGGAELDMDVQPAKPHFKWDNDNVMTMPQMHTEDGQVFTYVAPGEIETDL